MFSNIALFLKKFDESKSREIADANTEKCNISRNMFTLNIRESPKTS